MGELSEEEKRAQAAAWTAAGGFFQRFNGVDHACMPVPDWRWFLETARKRAAIASAPQASQPPQGAEPEQGYFGERGVLGGCSGCEESDRAGCACDHRPTRAQWLTELEALRKTAEDCATVHRMLDERKVPRDGLSLWGRVEAHRLAASPALAAPPQGASSLLPLREALSNLLTAAREVSRRGATPGTQWGKLCVATLKAEAALAASPPPAPQEPAYRNSTQCAWCKKPAVAAIVNGVRAFPTCPCGSTQFNVTLYAAPAPVDEPREQGSSDAGSPSSVSLPESSAEAGLQVAASASERAALTLLKHIRGHAKRHDLDREWLTLADEVLGTWGPPSTERVLPRGKAVAWVASHKEGNLLHLSEREGWTVEVALRDPEQAPWTKPMGLAILGAASEQGEEAAAQNVSQAARPDATANPLPPAGELTLPAPRWYAVDTPGADYDTSFVSNLGDAEHLAGYDEDDKQTPIVELFTAEQVREILSADRALREQGR